MDQPNPNLDESAWSRALTATGRVYGSSTFQIGLSIVFLLASGIALIFTADSDASTVKKAAVTVVVGLVALVLVLIGAFLFELAAAPLRQRNQLRRAWPTEPIRKPVDSELAVREFARRGEDREKKITDFSGGYTSDDLEWTERWTAEIVQFLSEHVASETAFFISASKDAGNVHAQLGSRVQALEEIAERLAENE